MMRNAILGSIFVLAAQTPALAAGRVVEPGEVGEPGEGEGEGEAEVYQAFFERPLSFNASSDAVERGFVHLLVDVAGARALTIAVELTDVGPGTYSLSFLDAELGQPDLEHGAVPLSAAELASHLARPLTEQHAFCSRSDDGLGGDIARGVVPLTDARGETHLVVVTVENDVDLEQAEAEGQIIEECTADSADASELGGDPEKVFCISWPDARCFNDPETDECNTPKCTITLGSLIALAASNNLTIPPAIIAAGADAVGRFLAEKLGLGIDGLCQHTWIWMPWPLPDIFIGCTCVLLTF